MEMCTFWHNVNLVTRVRLQEKYYTLDKHTFQINILQIQDIPKLYSITCIIGRKWPGWNHQIRQISMLVTAT